MEAKLFLGQYLICVILLLGQLHGYTSCIQNERKALLELKKYIISISESGTVLTTWTNDTTNDCCQWEGVNCNHTSGRVAELSIRIPNLKENSLLNLSFLHPFEEVHSLDLSECRFGGLFDSVEGYKSLRKLKNLEILNLSSNKFNNSIFPFLNAATSLTTLFLQGNNMNFPFPGKELAALVKLKALDLSGNEFSGSMELQGICKFKNLQELDLSQNKLVGQIPLCITSLTELRVLDLSSNQLTGKLPSAFANLESLEYLSLLNNNFEGVFSLDSLANLSKLRVFGLNSRSNSLYLVSESSWKPRFELNVIALGSCNLEKVPQFLLHQKDLRHVDLSDNNISGNFPSWLLANNTKLEVLLLRNNYLTSFQLPKSAHNLLFLDVSVNEFKHLFPENIGWILPHLLSMNISKNGFQRNLPSSLGNMEKIEFLDISHNNFHGNLPRSFINGCYSLQS